MAMVAVSSSPNKTQALGDLEWEAYGGKMEAAYHPVGRVSHLYVTPDGRMKLRSWKQALEYMGEDVSGPLAQEAKERSKSILKSANKPCNTRVSQEKLHARL